MQSRNLSVVCLTSSCSLSFSTYSIATSTIEEPESKKLRVVISIHIAYVLGKGWLVLRIAHGVSIQRDIAYETKTCVKMVTKHLEIISRWLHDIPDSSVVLKFSILVAREYMPSYNTLKLKRNEDARTVLKWTE